MKKKNDKYEKKIDAKMTQSVKKKKKNQKHFLNFCYTRLFMISTIGMYYTTNKR